MSIILGVLLFMALVAIFRIDHKKVKAANKAIHLEAVLKSINECPRCGITLEVKELSIGEAIIIADVTEQEG